MTYRDGFRLAPEGGISIRLGIAQSEYRVRSETEHISNAADTIRGVYRPFSRRYAQRTDPLVLDIPFG